jgi:hypothetical protein
MSVRDYVNRRFDICAFRGAKAIGEVPLKSSLFDSTRPGEVCIGVQKLAQRWIRTFCLIRGSMRFRPDDGTDFIRVARQGRLATELDVRVQFGFAAAETQRQLVAEEDDTWAADERLGGVTLTRTEFSGTTLTLGITVTSQTLTGSPIILPVDVTPIAMDSRR